MQQDAFRVCRSKERVDIQTFPKGLLIDSFPRSKFSTHRFGLPRWSRENEEKWQTIAIKQTLTFD